MGKYFGTDGFRGEAGRVLTAEHAFKTGRYLGYYLKKTATGKEERKPRVVIGKDTRLSSYMLEYAIASGLTASGTDVYLLHVTTTPSVSYVTLGENFDLGIMITASHNPFSDNGIKIIDKSGCKLSDCVTDGIEKYLDSELDILPFAVGAEIGRIYDHYSGRNGYVGHLISLASSTYKSLKIGIDASNGAAFSIGRSVFAALGAQVYSIGDDPNGMNVNYECGSMHPEKLVRAVREHKLNVGFAFDGDADRCIAADENGNIVDGDAILYILAKSLQRKGRLKDNRVALTVMSNGGLIKSLSELGIATEVTKVGDRFVYERMQEKGLSLGGEQSGHIILGELATTGDGILTAIMLTEEMLEKKATLSELCRDLVIYPQRSESIKVSNKSNAVNDRHLVHLLQRLQRENKESRILVRESGTEPKIRIMVESESEYDCDKIIGEVRDLLKERGHTDE